MSKIITTSHGQLIHYQGPALEAGPKPAIIYFAVSGQASLEMDPFNQPLSNWQDPNLRIFSWDLPYHKPTDDFKNAMQQWALAFQKDPLFLEHFMTQCRTNLNELIANQWIDPHKIAVAGLSRGAFIATHLAAREENISYILGFAPLTRPRPLEEFDIQIPSRADAIDLKEVIPHLVNKKLRFYIGNDDTRVGTEHCYQFIRKLTEVSTEEGIRSPSVELRIYPSIGYKGHGTPPEIFNEGSQWLRQQLLREFI